MVNLGAALETAIKSRSNYILDYVQLYFTSYTSLIMNKILLNILILSTIVLAGCSSTNKLLNSPTT